MSKANNHISTSARLHKIMAERGVASRRRCEQLIAAGRVMVNGKTAQIGSVVSPRAEIRIDGRKCAPALNQQRLEVLMLNKQAGELCSRRPQGERRRVFEVLPRPRSGRWIMVGRLDLNSSGLLLFTNSGELAHKLMHPSSDIERVYAVRVTGKLSPESIQRLLAGVELEDGYARFESLSSSANNSGQSYNQWLQVSVRSGRKRMVRRLLASEGVQVSRLIRVAFGPQQLPKHLNHPRWRLLDASEVEALSAAAGLAASPIAY